MKFHNFFPLVPLFLSTTSLVFGEKTTQQHLTEGNALLNTGQFEDALKSFEAAINQDPSNYLSYFKRAATYLSLGRSSAAVVDFSKILELKPDFDQALLQRAKIYVKEGSYTEAKRDLGKYLNSNPSDAEAEQLLTSVKAAEAAIETAETLQNNKSYDDCIKHLTSAIQTSPHSVNLRLSIAKCHLEKGEVEEGIRDLTQASKLDPTNPETLIRLSKLNYFSLHDFEKSLAVIKQCLHYDPEHKECKKIFRRIKQLEKTVDKVKNDIEGRRWRRAVDKLMGTGGEKESDLINEIDKEYQNIKEGRSSRKLSIKLYGWTCKAYQELKDGEKALEWCTLTLKHDPDNVDALANRAEAHILLEDFEAAVRDYTKAQEIAGDDDHSFRENFQRAHRLLKSSKKKDYYKILGIPRSALKQDVKKSYRKLAQKWHPDKYSGDLSPSEVEAKMSAINEAYEVLGDDQLRERYDNGDDPNDPTGGAQEFYAHNPFAQFAREGGFQFGSFQFSSSRKGKSSGGGDSFFEFNFPL